MELIVTAHKKEAQSFIHNLKLTKQDNSTSRIYSNKKSMLLICGQGIQNVDKNMDIFFKNNTESISRIINIGIAGRLNDSINILDIYPINKVILFTDAISKKEHFLKKNNAAKKCVSVLDPVSNINVAQMFSSYADIVDMELWALANAALKYGIPLFSFKLISDDAWAPISVSEIKRKALLFSDRLFEYYTDNLPQIKEIQ